MAGAPVLAVWPGEPSEALGRVLAEALGGSVVTVEPHAAAGALASGAVDLALVPTLAVLRDVDAFSLAPGAGLVGERSPTRVLAIGVPLDSVETIAFDPRWGQEALLAQMLLREHFDLQPAFRPVPSDAPAARLLAEHGAALVAPEADLPDGTVVLDLGREWADLTSRPMVWGLVASARGRMDEPTARAIAAATFASGDPTGEGDFQLSLAGLGYSGLEAFADHLFYTGTLEAIPELPFVRVETGDEEPAEEDEDA